MTEEKKVANDEWFGRLVEILLLLFILAGVFNMFLPRLESLFNANLFNLNGETSISIPPKTDIEENLILGAIISGKTDTEDALNKLNENMFKNSRNRIVFLAAKSLFNDGLPININTLTARLSEQSELSNIGGRPYLEFLVGSVEELQASSSSPLSKTLSVIRTILLWIAVLSLIGIAYVSWKMILLGREEISMSLDLAPEIDVKKSDLIWNRLLELSQSDNPQDRKMAIIEADIILDNIVTKMGYSGDTLGEKLQKIEVSDFNSLQEAWEAHKFRNKIAHDDSVQVSKRDAQFIMSLYEKVFREFEYI